MAKELREIADVEAQIAKLSQQIATLSQQIAAKRLKVSQHQANVANWNYIKNLAGLKTEMGQMCKIDQEQ